MENNAPNLGLPLVFMYEGFIYSKEMDGLFHQFYANCERKSINSLGSITMDQARKIFADTKFISSIIVLTNSPSLKI